jgi:hypothetical protein
MIPIVSVVRTTHTFFRFKNTKNAIYNTLYETTYSRKNHQRKDTHFIWTSFLHFHKFGALLMLRTKGRVVL